jgi:hypothetical protein
MYVSIFMCRHVHIPSCINIMGLHTQDIHIYETYSDSSIHKHIHMFATHTHKSIHIYKAYTRIPTQPYTHGHMAGMS